METAGWSVQIDDDGSVTSGFVPEDQATEYEQASADCWESVGPPTFEALDTAERERYYSVFVAARDCIVDLGYEMPAPPSFQSWVDMQGGWSPYVDVDPNLPVEEQASIEKECPINP